MSTNFDEFKRSLDALVNQAQQTARLGLDVAKDQVETITHNPNINDQFDEVRRNLQTMAREMETRAQELVHLASTYMQNRPTGGFGTGSAPTGSASSAQSNAGTTPPAEGESFTAAGAGTAQEGSDPTDSTPAQPGDAPRQ